jgi:hypothetical protein
VEGFSLRSRSTIWPVLALCALVAVILVAGRFAQPTQSAPASAQGPVSAVDACHLPGSDVKSGGAYQWQMAVRLDSPQETAIVFISGPSMLQCWAYRASNGRFDSTVTAGGGFQPGAGTVLTYEGQTSATSDDPYPAAMVFGQVPTGTATVDIVTTDGEHHSAAMGNGWYAAWATLTGPGDNVVEIIARDSSGATISRLADPSGLEPGLIRSESAAFGG